MKTYRPIGFELISLVIQIIIPLNSWTVYIVVCRDGFGDVLFQLITSTVTESAYGCHALQVMQCVVHGHYNI